MNRFATGIAFILVALMPYVAMVFRGGGGADTEAESGEPVLVLSPHRREVRLEYSRGFREWLLRVKGRDGRIVWLDAGGTSKILKDMESRFAVRPDNPGVDLLFGGGVAPYLTACERGWLEPVHLPEDALAGIPETCAGTPVYDPQMRWFGVALSGFGILYSRPLVSRLGLPPPEDWEDLARPEYFSWVGSGDPRSSGSVHMCYEILLQAYGFERGWEIGTRLCANVRGFGEAGGTVPREVAAGDVAAGMVIDQYAHTVIRESSAGDNLVFVLPARNTVIGPDAVGMIRNCEHRELAGLFIEYALSEEGQRLLCRPAGQGGQRFSLHRLPVLKALYGEQGTAAVNPYDAPAAVRYDGAKASKRWDALNDLMGAWWIDAHEDLRKAWRAVISRGMKEDEVSALCAPPVSEEQLVALAAEMKDARRRQGLVTRWALEARERYRSLARGASPGDRKR